MKFIHKIRQIFLDRDARVLVENFVSLSALKVVGIVLPLVTLPYILRILGFEKYGVIVFATSLVAYFQSLTDYSFKITATRDVAIFRNSPQKLNIIYSRVMTVKTLFLALSYSLILLVVLIVPLFREYSSIYLFCSLMLIGHTIFPEWFFQGIERMKYITFLNIGVRVFFTVFVFVFIRKEEDFWIYPLLSSLGYIVAGVIGQFIIVRKYNLRFHLLSIRKIKSVIRNNFAIFINQFVPNLYNNSSVFLLGILTSSFQVGIYNAILTIVNLLIALIEIVSRVFFPYLNRRRSEFKTFQKYTIIISFLIVIFTILMSDVIFWYLNISHGLALHILSILSIGVIGYTFYTVYGVNFFLVRRHDKIVMWNTIFSSVIGLLLAFPLINYFGIIGAAINLSFCRILMGGGLYIKYISFERNNNGVIPIL